MEDGGKNKNLLVFLGLAALVIVAIFVLSRPNNSAVTEQSTMDSTSDSMMESESSDAMMDDSVLTQDENTAPVDTMMDESTAMMQARVIEVEGGSFYYEPNEIRVKAGEKVRIVLNSVDMMHDFVIDELNVRTEVIPGGESTSVEFVAGTPGEYEFYCSVGQHRANGMTGTLIVE